MERTSDELERASNIALAHDEESIAAVRRLAAPEQDPSNIDPDCVDCGEEIEEGRLELLYCRCFRCQTLKERKDKTYAKR